MLLDVRDMVKYNPKRPFASAVECEQGNERRGANAMRFQFHAPQVGKGDVVFLNPKPMFKRFADARWTTPLGRNPARRLYACEFLFESVERHSS